MNATPDKKPGDKKPGVVGRFAPSPTGPLHTGSLVAAVGSYCMARRANGLWLMRMEDLDTPRVVPGMGDDILRTLEGLGFEWDGSIVYQSQRTHAYEEAFATLLEMRHAYPCGCTRKEIREAASAPHAGDEGPAYPGTCRGGLPEGRAPRSHRIHVGDREITFDDLILGPRHYPLETAGGDFVIKRADGVFAYQLAVVVDDAAAGVNQVVRGADLLPSTPRQILLGELLALHIPAYGHLPLVTGPDGDKLSKRDNLVSLHQGTDLAHRSGPLIHRALTFLGQAPPKSSINWSGAELLGWGADHFEANAVPATGGPA